MKLQFITRILFGVSVIMSIMLSCLTAAVFFLNAAVAYDEETVEVRFMDSGDGKP